MSKGMQRYRARLLRKLLTSNIDRNQVARDLRIGIKGKESIFEMLVRTKNALDIQDATTLLSIIYPPPFGGTWRKYVDRMEDKEFRQAT
jgi:hypothetical protein